MFTRTQLLLGEEGVRKLQKASVLVVGLGGVGGYALEQLCRSGIGKLTIVDGDIINESNRNRQIIALQSTRGKSKALEFEKRCHNINPDCEIITIDEYLQEEQIIELLDNNHFDYVVDAIDTLSPKVSLIQQCVLRNIPLVSSMGSGGKLDPSLVRVDEVEKSHHCPLAFIVRKRLHQFGIRKGFKVVYSPEKIPQKAMIEEFSTNKRTTIGTISYMPPIFGCYCASVVIRGLIGNNEEKEN